MYDTLRKVGLFQGLDDGDLAQLCGGSGEVAYEPGDTLFVEGDPGDRAYVITSGEFEIVKRSGEREVLLAVRRPPDSSAISPKSSPGPSRIRSPCTDTSTAPDEMKNGRSA